MVSMLGVAMLSPELAGRSYAAAAIAAAAAAVAAVAAVAVAPAVSAPLHAPTSHALEQSRPLQHPQQLLIEQPQHMQVLCPLASCLLLSAGRRYVCWLLLPWCTLKAAAAPAK
jgi:hypothetical protein